MIPDEPMKIKFSPNDQPPLEEIPEKIMIETQKKKTDDINYEALFGFRPIGVEW